MKRRVFELAVAVALLCSWPSSHAAAKELDQFTDRLRVLAYYAGDYRAIPGAPSPAQVDAVLDARMNELLDELLGDLNDSAPDSVEERDAFVRRVFQHRYLPELITPYEEWVKHEAPVPLYKVRDKGIYGHAVDYDDMRMTWYIELSPIIQVGGVAMGIDKLGHYLAQGFQYYEYYQQLDPRLTVEARAQAVRVYGHKQEYAQLGIATGGVYSYADLAANWSGMLFFLALFDDVALEGVTHARLIAPDGHGYKRARAFHWAEWVSADWDEVQNPARTETKELFDKVRQNFWRPTGAPGSTAPSVCETYRKDPRAFIGPYTQTTRSRYALPELADPVTYAAIDVQTICELRLADTFRPQTR
ncbi:MAG: hypothetical protein RL701_5020 [Pseudomonadota bacterium]